MYRYFCPSCHTGLSPQSHVVLGARKGKRRGLVILNPEPGNYEVFASDSLELVYGDIIDFFCPVCQAELRSNADDRLVRVRFRGDDGQTGAVSFSRIFGEHATYLVTEDRIRTFGESAGTYGACNFFGEGADR
jgi:hypothetical protein